MTVDVSLLLPIYNLSKYPDAYKCIESVLKSKYSVEILCVDDCSTDNSIETLKEWSNKESRISYYSKQHHLGPMSSLNVAASHATGKYFIAASTRAWLDTPGFDLMVQTLETHPNIHLVYGSTQYHGSRKDLHVPPPFRRNDFRTNFPSLQGFMYSRQAYDDGLRYHAAGLREGCWVFPGDWDFFNTLAFYMKWEAFVVPTTTYHYSLDPSGQQTHIAQRHPDVTDAMRRLWINEEFK